MTIHISPEYDAQDELKRVNISVDAKEWKRFQEVWQRGTNLWPDAPDFIKKAADIITSGKIMQDYMNMTSENRA
jgi:molybdenum cofactor biosynthesis enzyme MoaA